MTKGFLSRLFIYIGGLFVLTCGQRLFVESTIGAGAFDAFCVGLSQYNPISAGSWVTILSIVMFIISAFLEHRLPDFKVLISSFLFGILFDFWGLVFTWILPQNATIIGNIIIYFLGLLLAPLGTAIYFSSNFSKSAYDEIIVAIQTTSKFPIWGSKTILETTMLISAFIARGPIGVGTVITAFAFGPLLQKYMSIISMKKSHLSKSR